MSLEAEIKNLTGAMTRLAEGVEKLLSISQPGPAAPRKTNSNVDGAKIETLAAEVLESVGKATPAELAKGYGGSPAQVDAVRAEQLPAEVEHSIEVAQATTLPTFDDAKRAFLAIAQKYGAVEGTKLSKDVLSRYGVPNLKALPVEQYADFIELCGTVVAGGEV